ncbi:PREDICTED: carnitinyl-CoA dehydratase-like [Dufourea novaeangliae]|uniref:3-hydroxypropionyl-coenzyme A dehydratase n=1 Tax=Dufourea novaeangliae TaxID=178035 RepID=A0A154PDA4_DUFNO|nr:PREDICTED: carnitinyl-CoA dehydratase-like [Dufourea novaeangliae]KZC09885.1 3-hydroxypropionyl-coenzyme A dehydratase [Dufourea novaeangliae]
MHSLKGLSGTLNRYCTNFLRRSLTSKSAENTKPEEQREKNILIDYIEGVTTIGINRPDKKNCLDVATAQELVEELEKFENDQESTVGIIHGIGGNFCSGYDLKEIAQYNDKNEEVLPQFGPLADKVELCKKPVIAAINGYAVGVGFELALMCDLRVMEQSAVVGFLNRRFGIPILCGGTVRLPALIGYSRAMEVILTGRAVSAEEALSWGLITRYTSVGTVLGDAVNLAKSLVKFPHSTLLADRASAHYATFNAKQLEEALQFEKDNSSHLVFEEGVKGAKRFVTERLGRHGKFHNITVVDKTIKDLDKDLL